MSIRVITAIALCKILRALSRLLHRGGTAMPGRYALKICPQLLSVVSRGVQTVAVTGTNGKTTSARMIEEAFEKQGKSWFSNRSGANLISGITTEFVLNSTLLGKAKKDYAVIECDEGAAKAVFPQMRPRVVMVTNLFSDQLDRYGDVTNTLDNIREALKGSPDTVMVLNADCSLTASLAQDLPNRAVFYGINKGAAVSREMSELADAKKQLRAKQTDDEVKEAERQKAQAEMEAELATLRREKALAGHKASFLALGYEEKLAARAAEAITDGKTEDVFAAIGENLSALKQTLDRAALDGTPKPPASDGAHENDTLRGYMGL